MHRLRVCHMWVSVAAVQVSPSVCACVCVCVCACTCTRVFMLILMSRITYRILHTVYHISRITHIAYHIHAHTTPHTSMWVYICSIWSHSILTLYLLRGIMLVNIFALRSMIVQASGLSGCGTGPGAGSMTTGEGYGSTRALSPLCDNLLRVRYVRAC